MGFQGGDLQEKRGIAYQPAVPIFLISEAKIVPRLATSAQCSLM